MSVVSMGGQERDRLAVENRWIFLVLMDPPWAECHNTLLMASDDSSLYDRLLTRSFSICPAPKDSSPPPVDPAPPLLTTDELWYHYAATSRMYFDMGRPVPDNVRAWAREQVETMSIMSYVDPDFYARVPILKLVCIYGIRYGVHGHLENYYLATGKVDRDNIGGVAERLAMLLSVRDYITRFWDHMIQEIPTQAGPRVERGDFYVRCSFSPLGGWGCLENTSRITASLYGHSDSSMDDLESGKLPAGPLCSSIYLIDMRDHSTPNSAIQGATLSNLFSL